MYIFVNQNPQNKLVGDCTIRAISTALNQEWQETYIGLLIEGYIMYDMPSANRVWGNYITQKGFKRQVLPTECPTCYTVKDFCDEHPHGTYILAISGHVVAVIDGNYYDTWDSGDENPIYYWERKEEAK